MHTERSYLPNGQWAMIPTTIDGEACIVAVHAFADSRSREQASAIHDQFLSSSIELQSARSPDALELVPVVRVKEDSASKAATLLTEHMLMSVLMESHP
jgi:hypothetical protein